MSDPFVGTWTLNPTRSAFDPNQRPSEATMTWELEADGTYLLRAAGLDAKGKRCEEKPQRLRPDGTAYPIGGLPGLTSVTTRPDPNTIRAEAKREDGSMAGEGTYVVADDGKTMTATAKGFDSQLRPFTQQTVWDRTLSGGSLRQTIEATRSERVHAPVRLHYAFSIALVSQRVDTDARMSARRQPDSLIGNTTEPKESRESSERCSRTGR